MTEAQLFPLAPMNAAREAFKGILYAVDGAIEKRLESIPDSSASHSEDIAKLNAIVRDLRTELGELNFLVVCLCLGLTWDAPPFQIKLDPILLTTPIKHGRLSTNSSRARIRHAFFRLRWT